MNAEPHLFHRQHHPGRRGRPALIVLGAVLLLVVLVVGAEQLWQRGFGFTAAEAWALSVGLWAYIALVALIMAVVAWAITHER